jgi:hypothetical protein
MAMASNQSNSSSRCQLQAPLSAGIKRLEEDMDVLIVTRPLRVTSVSIYLPGAVL